MSGKKRYVATRDFNTVGHGYQEGDEWRGSVEEAEKQVAEGNLRPDDDADDGKTDRAS